MKLNVLKAWYAAVMAFFMFSERLWFLKTVDRLHIKHYILIITIFLSIIILNGRKVKQLKEFAPIFISTGILYLISLFFQLKEGRFKLYSLEEVYYLLIPLIFIIIVYSSTQRNYMDDYINMFFAICIICLIVTFIKSGKLSFSNFLQLFNFRTLFIDSESPIMESDLSNFFTLFYLYYFYKNDKIRRIIALFFCFLAYKRFAFLYALFAAVILRFVQRNKKTPKSLMYITMAGFIIAPFVTYYICDDTFANWFYQKTGLDFNEFTQTRFEIINTVIDQHLINYGLGTVSAYLERRSVRGQLNMHNDILRIYMETTIIGTISLTYSYFKVCKNNIYQYIIMLFIFCELYVNHFLGTGSVAFWFITYLMLMQLNVSQDEYNQRLAKRTEDEIKSQLNPIVKESN